MISNETTQDGASWTVTRPFWHREAHGCIIYDLLSSFVLHIHDCCGTMIEDLNPKPQDPSQCFGGQVRETVGYQAAWPLMGAPGGCSLQLCAEALLQQSVNKTLNCF